MIETFAIPADHPALAGHFPDDPLVPGVVILDRLLLAAHRAGHHVDAIGNAKFIAPLRLDTPCEIHFETGGDGPRFTLTQNGETIARGSLRGGDR